MKKILSCFVFIFVFNFNYVLAEENSCKKLIPEIAPEEFLYCPNDPVFDYLMEDFIAKVGPPKKEVAKIVAIWKDHSGAAYFLDCLKDNNPYPVLVFLITENNITPISYKDFYIFLQVYFENLPKALN